MLGEDARKVSLWAQKGFIALKAGDTELNKRESTFNGLSMRENRSLMSAARQGSATKRSTAESESWGSYWCRRTNVRRERRAVTLGCFNRKSEAIPSRVNIWAKSGIQPPLFQALTVKCELPSNTY